MSGERGAICKTAAEYAERCHDAAIAHKAACQEPILYRDSSWREFSVWTTQMSCPNCGFFLQTEVMSGKKADLGYGFVSWKLGVSDAAV